MPGRLKSDELVLDDSDSVRALIGALGELAGEAARHHRMTVSKRYYFKVPDGLPDTPGWYVIRSAGHSLYVGTAENLNLRLNSENGSRDQFANPKRESDSERNFIKSFSDVGVLDELWVIAIDEPALVERLQLSAPLTRRDRHNVEKVLNLFREFILVP